MAEKDLGLAKEASYAVYFVWSDGLTSSVAAKADVGHSTGGMQVADGVLFL